MPFPQIVIAVVQKDFNVNHLQCFFQISNVELIELLYHVTGFSLLE